MGSVYKMMQLSLYELKISFKLKRYQVIWYCKYSGVLTKYITDIKETNKNTWLNGGLTECFCQRL